MDTNKTVTCSFTLDRNTYNAFKSIVVGNGENVKGNLVRYMQQVIRYSIPNAETIEAIEDVKRLKNNPNKKTYHSFSEILDELENENDEV